MHPTRHLFSPVLAVALLTPVLIATSAHAQQPGPGEGPEGRTMLIRECEIEGTEHIIDVGGRKLHGIVYGEGSPTVVLISGYNAPQAYWNGIIPDIAEKATVVTYDRAGYGVSEIGELPVDGGQSATDLDVLLREMGVPRPYLTVGHSYGATVARLFAVTCPDDMGGLILVDGQHEDILDEQRRVLDGQDLEKLEEMVVRMKEMADPQSELASRSFTAEQLRRSGPLPEIPFVVITAADRSRALPPIFSREAQAELAKLGVDLQEKLVGLVPGGRHVLAEGVGHNVHVDKPEVLLDPLIEMIGLIQSERK